ncbi:hypothetical protein KZO83_07715 [Chromohalobacter sp. TMW 2.2308]|uniref:hypothetical protein n=1 Tax=Chromohalobacter TaxID=42054 RepID=UPI001FFD2737|nr:MULTISPECIES: hypothetical protein [Chromohalobacter]MCK2042574.1 hypothetical protein [Chromohalobacter moromii]MCT8514908.1 hypothetical protein [Chromohalobacter sp. TMW 2.2271]
MPTIPQEIAESTEKLTTNTDIVDQFVHGPATIYIPVRGGTLRPLLYWQGTFQDKVVELAGPYVQQAEDSASAAAQSAQTAAEKRDQTALDAQATAADRQQTGIDRQAAADSATASSESATTAGEAQVAAETARDKSKAWASQETGEVEPGLKSAKQYAEEAASYGDPNAFNITADQTSDTRRLDEWAGQARANQQELSSLVAGGNFTAMPTINGDPIVESGSNSFGDWVRFYGGRVFMNREVEPNYNESSFQNYAMPLTGDNRRVSGGFAKTNHEGNGPGNDALDVLRDATMTITDSQWKIAFRGITSSTAEARLNLWAMFY